MDTSPKPVTSQATKGGVLYSIPQAMELDQESRCEVRIAFDKALLLKDFGQNPYLSEDPTRINLKVTPEKCLPPIAWEKGLSPDEKQKRIEKGPTYIYVQYFVFKKDKDILTDDMMIDFNNTFNIRRKELGNNNEKMLPVKVFQLSDETRETLRQKLVAYYIRKPEEE